MAIQKNLFLQLVLGLVIFIVQAISADILESVSDAELAPGDLNLVGTVGSKTFYIQKGNFTWAESLDFCHESGMTLAAIENQDENDLIFNYLQNLPHPWVPKDIWLAGTDLFSEGTYKWLKSGQEFEYSNWNSTEEAVLGADSNCLYLYSIDSFWYGDSCSSSVGKIPLCEDIAA